MKMPIRIYNRFLDLKIEIDTYQSLQYGRNFHGVGTFEIHINRYMHGAEHFQKGNIIALSKQENKAGIIVSREIVLDESGKASENFKITGTTMDGIINRRTTVPPSHTSHDRKSGNAETVMKHYIDKHFVNPTDKSRKIDILEIAPNQNRGSQIEWESRYKNIDEEIEKISLETGLGWGVFVNFNTKKLIFDCFESKDLTQGNPQGYSPVFFSPEFETIKSQSFVDSNTDYKNVGYVGGQGEGVERKIIELGDANGWDRIETFVDARDVGTEDEETEEDLTEEEIEQLLIDRGKKKMKEMETLLSFEAEILTPVTRRSYEYNHEGYLHPAQPEGKYKAKQQQITPFQYEKDFNLGDKVQIVNKSWGLTMDTPIVEILEIHEPGGFRLEATFGESRPTIITKMKKNFDDIERVEKQEAVYKKINDVENNLNNEIVNIKREHDLLWEGAHRLSGTQTVYPTKTLKECRNGWLLVWQRIIPGEGIQRSHYNYVEIPKEHINEGSISMALGYSNSIPIVRKIVYPNNESIRGDEYNTSGDSANLALGAVLEW